MHPLPHHQRGFTLLELSIVLVIIGLIVGGVLVGRDLIRAAEIRGTIAQVEKFNSASNTFRTKYNYYPGDMPPAQTLATGLFTFTGGTAGTGNMTGTGWGNNNGHIDSQEQLPFWQHLSQANLIEGSYGVDGAIILNTNGVPTATASNVNNFLPRSKLSPNTYFLAMFYQATDYMSWGRPEGNFYTMYDVGLLTTAGMNDSVNLGTFSRAMSPIVAYNIDSKVDDGKPFTGKVLSHTGSVNATSANGNCIIGSYQLTDTYNILPNSGGNTLACGISFKFAQ